MDPISISVELELGSLILGFVGLLATWMHHQHEEKRLHQRERHFHELKGKMDQHHPVSPAEAMQIHDQ